MNVPPIIAQYLEIHAEVPDAILFFRLGDFYEMFYSDAELAARVLGITLTSRNKNDPEPIPMAGVPYHSAESYITKLLEHGYTVAVCEQMGDPAATRGPVERRIVRIATPGTAVDDAYLDKGHQPWVWAWAGDGSRIALAAVDFQSGRQAVGTFSREGALDRLRVGPAAELIVAPDDMSAPRHEELDSVPLRRAAAPPAGDSTGSAGERRALGLLRGWLAATQRTDLAHLQPPEPLVPAGTFALDARTVRNLEIFRNIWDGSRRGSLIDVLDRCATRMGTREIETMLRFPLCDPAAIAARSDEVAALVEMPAVAEAVAEQLRGVPDLMRVVARLSQRSASPLDVGAARDGLRSAAQAALLLGPLEPPSFRRLAQALGSGAELAKELSALLVDQPPRLLKDGGVFRSEADPELADLRRLADGGAEELAAMEQREREATGIASLKIGYNKVFGYYIEITHAHREKVPARYHRKQTLTGAERYITDELKALEERILGARERAVALEQERFAALLDRLRSSIDVLQRVADACGRLDARVALALVARERRWVRPIVHAELDTEIIGGRHPVLEADPDRRFVANDARFDPGRRVLLITGPNMGGKSTYMRAIAQIVLLAQIGSFVPAQSARIGYVDQIFSRVGAADALWRGQSTFMVEMEETADLVRRAGPRSLVVLDEIGRGTSTWDGMSIAQAVIEHLHDNVGARVLFATHFHELAELDRLAALANVHVEVRTWQGRVVFLYSVAEGPASHSYGVDVAALAGLPAPLVRRAEGLLAEREGAVPARRENHAGAQLTLFAGPEAAVVRRLRVLDVDRMTPLEALAILADLKAQLGDA